MCGICGYVAPASQAPDRDALERMRDVLAHRGPDGEGELEIEGESDGRELRGWLGFRRLKIIDLTERSDQPMVNDPGSIAVLHNGEIYNFRELRRELEAHGFRFRSTGDAEVVLRAYEAWGEEFVERLDGMFAIALWDGPRAKLVLARDRAGKKPLFYAIAGNALVFGSEIKSLSATGWLNPTPDWSRLPEFLIHGYVAAPATLHEGVFQVPPASLVVYDAAGLHPAHEYWSPLPREQDLRPSPAVFKRVAELLDAATRRRLVADVPIGALLSGGADSSVVVGLMSRASAEPVHTFSIGFPEEPSYDERRYARAVGEHFGTRHTEFAVRVDAVALLDRLVWHHDGPFADSSAIPTYLVSQLARDHVTVVLNGDGGDEVLAGYERFAAAALAARLPHWVESLGFRMTRMVPASPGYYSTRRRLERFFAALDYSLEDRYLSWVSVVEPARLHDLLAHADWSADDAGLADHYRRARRLPRLDRILYANFKTYLPGDLAVKMDRMSMANSLEARSPFLDTALVEFLARLPARHKIGFIRPKPVLRQALSDLLPRSIWNRRKHGFGVPVAAWFRGSEVATVFEDEVLASDARTASLLHAQTVRRMWNEHRSAQFDHGGALWTFLTLERWLRANERPAAIKPPSLRFDATVVS